MWFVLFLFLPYVVMGSTCNDLINVYQNNCQACSTTNNPVSLCGTGTEWSSTRQQCVISTMVIQEFRHNYTYIPVRLGALKGDDGGWHTCTCLDNSTYQCQSNQGDGAACCDRSMPAICGEGNVDLGGYKFNTGAWHTCTCADGTTYQCQSNRGDGAACCTRSMSAICGTGNVGSADIWHTCTCADGTTYDCQSAQGDGGACCERSMPAICPSAAVFTPPVYNALVEQLDAVTVQKGGWHTCTCKDGSTYECKSNHGDGNACCTRSMPAICGEGNVPSPDTNLAIVQPTFSRIVKIDTNDGWHTCTCKDGSTYQCQSNQNDGDACCTRSETAICGEGNV